MKKLIVLLILIMAPVAGYYFWKNKNKPVIQATPPTMEVVTYKVVPSQLTIDLSAIGTLQAFESTVIRTEVAGKVDQVNPSEGKSVKKGDLILQIDDANYKQDVEQKKAAFELAELTYNRNAQLVKSGAATTQSKDEAYASMMMKKAEYESSKIYLEKTKILAPYDGVLGVTNISIGEYLTIGAAIINISEMDPILVQFPVPQNFFSKIKQNDPISITVDAWPEKEFQGKIYAIDPQLDVETRRITVKGSIPNTDNLLRPGMFAYVTLPIGVTDNALLVPEEALIPSADQIIIFKVVDDVVQTAKVKIGVRQHGLAEITKGLKPDDLIITAGQLKVRDGMTVKSITTETSLNDSYNTQK